MAHIAVESIDKIKIMADLDRLAKIHSRLNTLAFGLVNATTPEESANYLSKAELLLIAEFDDEPVGFGTYQLIHHNDMRIIYQSRGIVPEAQNLGIGRAFPQIASEELRATHLMAKAQNPISIASSIRSELLDAVFPIDSYYDSDSEMTTVLIETVEARGKSGLVNLSNGLVKKSYKDGKLGAYNPHQTNHTVNRVISRLTEIGLNANEEDAVYYGGKLK